MHSGILSTIGHTPLIKLEKLYPYLGGDLYAKLEMYNPGGSIKDRPAYLMLARAIDEGLLSKGDVVIESSSGNMALGLAQACRYFELQLIVVVDPKINRHTCRLLKACGACIEKVNKADDGGNYLASRLARVHALLDEIPGSFWPNQYANKDNPLSHHNTMKEIIGAMAQPPDYLLVATSTCGTIMGCANYIQQHGLTTKIVAIDAVGSVIFGSTSADRLVPGHGAGRPSDLLDKSMIDRVIEITDKECVIGCRRLLRREAILAGGSSGALVMAAEKLSEKIQPGSALALILPDNGERYLDTIYDDDWVRKHFGNLNALNADHSPSGAAVLKPQKKEEAAKDISGPEPHRIAIIGGGPKGMYGLERLAAQLATCPPVTAVQIHVYDRSAHFGAGHIYQPHQPEYLLMNNAVGDVNMWIDEEPEGVVPDALSMTRWLSQEEGIVVKDEDFVSRASVGRYLGHGFAKIMEHLPANVQIKLFGAEVIDICKKAEKYGLTVKPGGSPEEAMPFQYDRILLATGHPKNKLDSTEKKLKEFAESQKNGGFIPFIYPVERNLKTIPPKSIVGVKGIGLTFIDAVLALTEGRGGGFEPDSSTGKQTYIPSGEEPEIIYPFSRSGLPMVPRGPALKAEPLRFFTEQALQNMKENSPRQKIDFIEDLLPLLKKEMIYAFYRVKLSGREQDLTACRSFEEVAHNVKVFHNQHPEEELFDPDAFLAPLEDRTFSDCAAFHAFIKQYWEFWLRQARRGESESPWAAVTGVWRKATPLFGRYYAFGGMTPASQRFFDQSFRRLLNRVTFGPPVESIQKMVALIDTGILNFSMARNPEVKQDESIGAFILRSLIDESRLPVRYLVDARISKVSLPRDSAPLYRNLLARGLITLFENRAGEQAYQPGCIAVTSKGFVVDKEGKVNTSIAVTGTPTEGITFDNDALARERNNNLSDWAAFVSKSIHKSFVDHYAV